jgi:preprotein translocase SecF subunit
MIQTAEKKELAAKPKRHFEFIGRRKIFYAISIALVVVGILSIAIRGFNFDIDFVGGTTMHLEMKQAITPELIDQVNLIVEDVTGEPASQIQETGDSGSQLFIKTKQLDTQARDNLFKSIQSQFSLNDADRLQVENVSATVGKDLRGVAVKATGIAILLMLIYIWIRFELRSGLAAIIAMAFDVFMMMTVFSLFQIPVNINFIAAVLTILGYSINATIIVFDRIRENVRMNRKTSFEEHANNGVNSTLARCVNTNLTVLFTIGMVYILGVPAIKNFSLPIIVGIVSGLYSSVCLSSGIWVDLRKIGKQEKLKIR